MELRLRQVCLIARELAPAIAQLKDIFGLEVCYIDSAVGVYGLENSFLPVGNQQRRSSAFLCGVTGAALAQNRYF
jgi:hypothetical protein|tara:strand:+ start:1161 stop:1385 length:225 start_codon:yes stop_codon:yes gene_type:complete